MASRIRSWRSVLLRGWSLLGLLALAGVLLGIGLAFQRNGLSTAANVAQLASIALALPPLVVPLVRKLQRTPVVEVSGNETGVTPPLKVSAEITELDWVKTANGELFPASGHVLRIYIEGTEDQVVLLRGLRAVIVARTAAIGFIMPHLGVVTPRPFELRLDVDPPIIRALNRRENFPFKVSSSDPEVLDLKVRLARGDVSWYLVLDWACSGEYGELRIDAGGKPFHTVGRDGLEWVGVLPPAEEG